jgi:cyclopropane fatty-acyl-phospholipid synthase-like methyltransferase
MVDMLKTLNVVQPSAITLQIGCGIGRIERYLHTEVQFCYGIDIAPTMIARAKSNVQATNVSFICASRLAGLLLQPLDLIYAIFVFQHLPRDTMNQYIRDAHAKLQSDGRFVFQILVDEAGETPDPPREHPYGLRYYRRADLAALLSRTGFTDVRFFSFPDAAPDCGTAGDLLVVASKAAD